MVTARRKEENLKDVPLSITVLSGATLSAAAATSLQVSDLSDGRTFAFKLAYRY